MTDLDAPPPRPRRVEPTARPGLWRALSFLLVLVAAAVTTIWILQSRAASDVAARSSRTLDLQSTGVFVDDLQLPPGARVAVLGFDHREATPIGLAGTRLDIPNTTAAAVALLDADGDLHGLRLVSRPADRERIVITPASTAHGLLVLSPSFLDADLERARQKVEFIDDDPAFASLVAAIGSAPNLGGANEAVEVALAAILDRVRGTNPLFDQGCDSILNPAARAVAGTCAVPGSSGATINNEQDRWVLAFASPEPYATLCAAIAPAGTPGSQRTVTRSDCGDRALLAASGPIIDRSAERSDEIVRIHVAAAFQQFSAYAAPMADLVGGVAGLNRTNNTHVLAVADALAATATDRLGNDPAFESALDVIVGSATPVERHAATVAAARVLLTDPAAYVEDWDPGASMHRQFLDLFDRVGERMLVSDRSEWRWTADAVGFVELGGDS